MPDEQQIPWTKLDTWEEDYQEGRGTFGDYAVGTAYYSLYGRTLPDGREQRCEVAYYVERCETTNLPEVREAYICEERDEFWTIEMHGEDDYGRDKADIEYGDGHPSVLYYDTIESAEKVCKRAAAEDESYKLNPYFKETA